MASSFSRKVPLIETVAIDLRIAPAYPPLVSEVPTPVSPGKFTGVRPALLFYACRQRTDGARVLPHLDANHLPRAGGEINDPAHLRRERWRIVTLSPLQSRP